MGRPRLNDVFPDWLTGGGIFGALQAFDVPWKTESIATSLDLIYHGDHSGDKLISPLVRRILSGDALTPQQRTLIATAAVAAYGVSWGKEYLTRSLIYDPIENYSMTEQMHQDQRITQYGRTDTETNNLSHAKTGTETLAPNTTETRSEDLEHTKTGTETQTPDTTETRTDDLTHSKTGTDTLTHDVTDERTDDLTDTLTLNTTDTRTPATVSDNSMYAFNSSTAVPVTSQAVSGTDTDRKTGTETTTHAGTVTAEKTGTETTLYNTEDADEGTVTTTREGTDTMTYNTTEADDNTVTTTRTGMETTTYNTSEADTGTQTHALSGSDSETHTYRMTRSGNIGVTTSQQMIEQERQLWMWDYFRDVVFRDLDRLLTLPIYS